MIFDSLLDRPHAQTLWDYQKLNHALKPADFLLLICNYNLATADYLDVLSMQKKGKFVVVSGGSYDTQGMSRLGWDDPEHIVFKERLMELGHKENNLIIEPNAMTMAESIKNTHDLLMQDEEADYNHGIIVMPPHYERRAFATAQKAWPNMAWQVTSPNVTYDNYIKEFDEENLIHLLVGEIQRIIEYGDKQIITPQEIPDDVMLAYKKLLDKGYTKHLIKKD